MASWLSLVFTATPPSQPVSAEIPREMDCHDALVLRVGYVGLLHRRAVPDTALSTTSAPAAKWLNFFPPLHTRAHWLTCYEYAVVLLRSPSVCPSKEWRQKTLMDDPVKESNTRGTISFATSGPNSRTTQLFINFGNNANLDGMGFSPFGKVVQGMDVVDRIFKIGEKPNQVNAFCVALRQARVFVNRVYAWVLA